ncbi:MAG TPA: protein phosphatase 2C domain-containing protein [Rhodocyclaceae bacterium]
MRLAPVTIDACAVQHIGDRREQQDRLGLFQHPKLKKIALAVVADGMGGHAGGALAAEQVVLTAKNSLEQYSPREDEPQQMLKSCLEEGHFLIRSHRFVNEQDPHSTGVMLLIEPDRLSWAHCGDSRLYRFRDKRCISHTRDHSFVEELVRRGKATAEEAAEHPNRNLLVTSLGGNEAPQIAVDQVTDLEAGDAFLLCSDGLWGYFKPDELARTVCSMRSREAAAQLMEVARLRGKGAGDNISLIVLRFLASPA